MQNTASAQTQSANQDNPKVKAIRNRIKPITADERLERMERARKHMADQKIDALLLEGGVTLNYYSGANWGRSERLFAMVLPRSGDPEFVAPKFEQTRALEQVGSWKLRTWEEHESPFDLVAQILKDKGITTGTVGVEETVRYFVSDKVSKSAPGLTMVSGTPVTAGCRSVKTAHELELMQIANDILKEVYLSSLPTLKEGMTERELGTILTKLFADYGVEGGALVLFGEAAASPHGTVKVHTLQEGQVVLMDGGCTVEGYNSDVSRTTVFGKPSDKMKKVFDIVYQAQTAALKTAKPGVPGQDMDAAARKVIVDAGYGPDYKYFTHRVGHGIGMDGHEWYYLVRGNTRPVVANNTFSDEPGIYIPGEFGIRIEDELQITEDGARLMLPPPVSLEEIFS
jgi:Xaa-Pro dipeptidase